MVNKTNNIPDLVPDEKKELTAMQQRLYLRLQAQLAAHGEVVRVMGKSGSGKSLLAAKLLDECDAFDIVHITQPNLSRRALLISACTQLGVEWEPGDHLSGLLFEKLKHRIESVESMARPLLLAIDSAEKMGLPALALLLSLLESGAAAGQPVRLLMLGRPELERLMRLPGYDELLQYPVTDLSLDSFPFSDYASALMHWLSFPKFRSKIVQWLKAHPMSSIKWKSLLHSLLLLLTVGGAIQLLWSVDDRSQVPDWRIVANWEQPSVHPDELAPPPDLPTQKLASPMDGAFETRILAGGNNADESFHKLFALWGIKGVDTPAEGPCRQVAQYNLRCLKGAGDWGYLSRTEHPALLVLWPNLRDPAPRFALFYGMRDGDPLLDYGEGPTVVARDVVEKYWRGDYLLFWRPNAPVVTMGPGSIGRGVIWMRSSLASWDGIPNNFSEIYDSELGRRLRDFQRTHQLKPDGLAGEKTMVILSRYSSDQNERPFDQLMPKLVGRFDSSVGPGEGSATTP